jgi:hypothetical protein
MNEMRANMLGKKARGADDPGLSEAGTPSARADQTQVNSKGLG